MTDAERLAHAFLTHMNRCSRERLADLAVLTEPAGTRAATEFTMHGSYVGTDPSHYNLGDWLRQVGG